MSSGVPARLDRPIELVVDVVLPIEEARELLRQAVERKVSIEESGNETGRRLSGKVTPEIVHLVIREANWTRRRKNWNVEFGGRFEEMGSRTTLRGVIDAVDRPTSFLFLLRAASIVVVAVAIVVVIFQGADRLIGATVAFAISAVWLVGAQLLTLEGERSAADDASTLAVYLLRSLGPGG
jgi:hypothetical protein